MPSKIDKRTSIRIKYNIYNNKIGYKFKGILVTHLKPRKSCQPLKTKPLHEQFGETISLLRN
jgi:hypothetical protein